MALVHTPIHELITYNAGNAADAEVFADFEALAHHKPAVIMTEEVSDRQHVLSNIPGYGNLQFKTEPASAHCALLIRTDLHYDSVDLVKISDRTFVGHHVKGSEHSGYAQPKYITQARVEHQMLGVCHFVPSAAIPRNKAARSLIREQAYHASQWIKHTNGILAGDFNAGPYSPFLKDLRKVATPYAVRSHGLRKIDMFWIPKGYYRHATVAGANGFSSDHRPVILHLGVK